MSAFGKTFMAIIGALVVFYGLACTFAGPTVMQEIHGQLVIITGILLWILSK